MDLAYLRAHPDRLPTFLTHQRIRETPVTGGDICDAARLTLDDGASVFAKSWPQATTTGAAAPDGTAAPPDGFFAAEAAGLRWLAEAGAVPVPAVVAELDTMLVLEWVDLGEPGPRAAEQFGRDLAALHRAGAERFGAPWRGYIGRLPLDNTPVDTGRTAETGPAGAGAWPAWFADRRLAPYLRRSADRGALSAGDVALVDRVIEDLSGYAGPGATEPPARLHGDLWPGNLHWAADGRVWLVDPAAHGGHRETDLALLGLFGGAPHLDRIRDAYQEAWPLADGWRDRIPLHQLYLLLVHTAMFGRAYRDAVVHAASVVRGTVGA